MDSSKQKEYISIAYLRSLAAKAKIFFSIDSEDSDSIDVKLKKQIILEDEATFWADYGVQLKSTSSASQYHEDDKNIYYTLKVKNYNDLIHKASTKKYLFLLILPEDSSEWVEQNVESLTLKKCMYWTSLLGQPETSNIGNIQISIPKINIVTENVLTELLHESVI